MVACASASAFENTPVRIDLYDASALPTFPTGKAFGHPLGWEISVTSIVSLQDGSLAVGGSDAESEPRVYLFSVDALNNAGSNAPGTASLAVSGPSFDRYVDAMLLLEDGQLAVGSFETVFLFEAASLRHAMLMSMHNVAANASLATTSGLGSMSLAGRRAPLRRHCRKCPCSSSRPVCPAQCWS